LLSLAFCAGCVEVHHHFDPIPLDVQLGWYNQQRFPTDGGSHSDAR
jgi:hypothetical protein